MALKKFMFLSHITLLCGVVSCANIFHDIQQDYPLSLPLMPQIEYIYPANNSVNVELNKSVLVSFNKDIDSTLLAGNEFTIVRDDGVLVDSEMLPYDDKLLIIRPEYHLAANRTYTVTQVARLLDYEGQALPEGYSWSFATGADLDSAPPYVLSTRPAIGESYGTENVEITARFSEVIDGYVIGDDDVVLRSSAGRVAGTAVQDPHCPDTIIFRPDADLEKNTLYTITVSGIRDLGGNVMPGDYSWNFRTGAVPVMLEQPSNLKHGFGTFGNYGPNIGRTLRSDEGTALGNYAVDGQSIYGLFDPGASGAFSSGKYVRIVESGVNVIAGPSWNGLGLIPYAKNLAVVYSPPSDRCYIDPSLGRFVLPRPSYWSRMENETNITGYADISEFDPLLEGSVSTYSEGSGESIHEEDNPANDGKPSFGHCLREYWYAKGANNTSIASTSGQRTIYPFGSTYPVNIRKGTISFWGRMNIDKTAQSNTEGYGTIYWNMISPALRVRIYTLVAKDDEFTNAADFNMQADIRVNGSAAGGPVVIGKSGQWYHFYIIWDADGIADGTPGPGKTVILYVNGAEVLSASSPLPASLGQQTAPSFGMQCSTYAAGARLYVYYNGVFVWRNYTAEFANESFVDNIKWFRDVVSVGGIAAPPGWEYNAGAGRQNALHAIYGQDTGDPYNAEYDFRPRLTGADSGVGYYYLP